MLGRLHVLHGVGSGPFSATPQRKGLQPSEQAWNPDCHPRL